MRELYGDPRPFVRDDGTVSPIWEARMTTVALLAPLPLGWDRKKFATRVRVNQAIAAEVEGVFVDLANFWHHLSTYDGGYVWRLQRGGSRLSIHGMGGAIDFDAPWNKLGDEPKMHPHVVRVFTKRGWTWGGRWKRPDGMHFQWGKGY